MYVPHLLSSQIIFNHKRIIIASSIVPDWLKGQEGRGCAILVTNEAQHVIKAAGFDEAC